MIAWADYRHGLTEHGCSDLKWVTDNWQEMTRKDEFNIGVFNQTGLLDRKRLERMMKVLI